MNYPIGKINNEGRFRELLIGIDYATKKYEKSTRIEIGNDKIGVPDIFIFKDNSLIACVELVGYTLGKINELKSHVQVDKFVFYIDLEKSTQIHTRQPHPFTLIRKKILGERKYERYNSPELILLIHTEVYVKNDTLVFAMDGIMQMNPSVNNFMHHKNEIIDELKNIIKNNKENQWNTIDLIDYTYSPKINQCPIISLFKE